MGGTWNLLEACRVHEVPAVVVASSDKAYGPQPSFPTARRCRCVPPRPTRRARPPPTRSPSATPRLRLPVAVTRFANVYGGGDLNFSRLIPEAIAAVLDGRPPQIRSDGSPERDFLFVDDAVAAYLAVEHAVGGRRTGGRGGVQRRRRAAALGRRGAGDDRRGRRRRPRARIPRHRQPGRRDRPPVRRLGEAARADRLAAEVELREGLIRTLEWYRDHPEARPGEAADMCGRFTVTAKDTKKIADRFQVELEKALERGGGEAPPPSKERAKKAAQGLGRYNVAPTQEILTVRSSPDPEEAAAGEREARLMRWGLVPRWAKDLKVGYRMINAKAENLTSSRAYGPLVGKFRHRCLIVADGFYEWMKAEDPKQPRQPWRFTVDGGEPFAFAGLCTRKEWEDEEERGFEDGWLYSCTIVTTTPNEVVAPVHNRMPVILPERRGRGGLAAPRPRASRTRWRCAARSTGGADGGAPANPKLNKVGKGIERARSCWSPRRAPPPAASSSSIAVLGARCIAARGRRTVASPALVFSVQETSTEGTVVVFQTDVEGELQIFLRLARRMKYSSARARSS